MIDYTYPAPPPEALVLARRLERAGYDDTDNQTTADWIATLHAYEELMATATRNASLKSHRRTDADGVVLTGQAAIDDAALAELGERVAALDRHADRMRKAVAYLGGLLDRYEALGTDPATTDEAERLRSRYIGLRVPVAGGPATTLRHLVAEAWRLAVRCREGYRLLSEPGKADAVAAWGPFQDASGDSPLWHGHIPQGAIDALDQRAAKMGVLTLHNTRGR